MTTFLLNKMCLENEKKSGKRRFTTFFQKTTVLLLPNWYRYILILIQHQEMERCGSVKESFEELLFTLHQLLHPSHYMIIQVHINCAKKGMKIQFSLWTQSWPIYVCICGLYYDNSMSGSCFPTVYQLKGLKSRIHVIHFCLYPKNVCYALSFSWSNLTTENFMVSSDLSESCSFHLTFL